MNGLKIGIIDDLAAPVVDVGHALRLIARMMVRNHEHAGEETAITPVSRSSSALTVAANPRPDHETNNEAA